MVKGVDGILGKSVIRIHLFFLSSRRRHTRLQGDWSSDVCSSDLVELANYTSDCCISVYIPTHRAGVEVNERMDSIAFKNALQQIEAILKDRGFDQTKVARLLKPGYDLLRNDKFWYALSDGLAVFIADGLFRYMKLLVTPTDRLLVNTSFYLSPLVPFILS